MFYDPMMIPVSLGNYLSLPVLDDIFETNK